MSTSLPSPSPADPVITRCHQALPSSKASSRPHLPAQQAPLWPLVSWAWWGGVHKRWPMGRGLFIEG